MTLRFDLHLHSCLSPCGDLANSPSAIARIARERGLDVVALTDHNSARNCPAFAESCRREGLRALFGTETTTREEVHVLSLFNAVDEALAWGDWIYARLPDFRHDPERFGDQCVVDADENILDFEERYLIPAIDASIDEIALETRSRGGLCIPAHIDRTANSIASQLGFLPDTRFDGVEVTRLPPALDVKGHGLVCNSDAHFPDDIGRRWFAIDVDVGAVSVSSAASLDLVATVRDALLAGTTALSIAIAT